MYTKGEDFKGLLFLKYDTEPEVRKVIQMMQEARFKHGAKEVW